MLRSVLYHGSGSTCCESLRLTGSTSREMLRLTVSSLVPLGCPLFSSFFSSFLSRRSHVLGPSTCGDPVLCTPGLQ